MTIPSSLDAWREVIHPAALILPRPNAADYAELKESIKARGLLTPLATFIDSGGEHWLLDGVSRLQALVELGQKVLADDGRSWAVATIPYKEEEGADPYEIALSLNITRRHLTPDQKRDLIRALREERPELSDRAIARMAGVSPHTVAAERRDHDEAEAETVQPNGEDASAYEEGDIREEGEPAAETPSPEPPPERREASGRRARGRKPGSVSEPEPPVQLPARPFIGTVLPSAPKARRVAEARRCIRYLQLAVDDLMRRTGAAAHG